MPKPSRIPPEYGESFEDNWISRIVIPAHWPLIVWAIVDKTGEKQAYSYTYG